MSANQSLQPTANPLRGLSAAELGRYAAHQQTEVPPCYVRRLRIKITTGVERMPTLEEVQAQIKVLGEVDTFGTKKEIRYLPEILSNDETVLSLTSGLMDGNTWLIVCTERRVIFLDKGMIYGLKQRETPLEKINSVEQKTGMMFGSIGIWDGAAHMEIKNVMKKTVKPFVEAVNRAREGLKVAEEHEQPPSAGKGSDITSQLERLADLRERGFLTDPEFRAQKAKILDM